MTEDVAAVAEVLARKRAEVEAEMAGLTARPDQAGDISFGKRVGDGTSIAVERITQVAAHDRLRSVLAEVQRAQQKLAEGTYGECDVCGSPIPPERLEALPWTTRCVEDAARR